jgi:hypothetical protein
MIRLKNINKTDKTIECDAYLEDCKEEVKLAYDIANDKFNDFIYPEGYEYCTSHIAKAKYFFKKCIEESIPLPKEKDIMWY